MKAERSGKNGFAGRPDETISFGRRTLFSCCAPRTRLGYSDKGKFRSTLMIDICEVVYCFSSRRLYLLQATVEGSILLRVRGRKDLRGDGIQVAL
jgi:hypothetical protein